MVGTKAGGLKAARTNRERYGKDFYKIQGRKGGMSGHTGGFAADLELARAAGAKGGRVSRRGSPVQPMLDAHAKKIIELYNNGNSIRFIAAKFGVSDRSVSSWLKKNY